MNLFAFGSNGSGQLGIGHTEDVTVPTECLFTAPDALANDEITRIVAGGNHTLLLTKYGHVYAAGCNSDNRCGPDPSSLDAHLDTQPRPVDTSPQTQQTTESNLLHFRRIVLTDPASNTPVTTFKCASATWEGTLLVASVPHARLSNGTPTPASEDKVFVLGSTPKGELGLGESTHPPNPAPAPGGTSIPDFPPPGCEIIALASGMSHTVAVLSNGEVYGWGGARKGQLGPTQRAGKIAWTPVQVGGIPFPATGAVCGREFTVVLGARERGEFVVLGDSANRWGVLDVPDTLRRSGEGYLDIGASWHGIYVQRCTAGGQGPAGSSGSSLVAWGRDDRGQLPPADLPAVRKIAIGSEHGLAVLQDGSVVAFGWGEHGNCGPETDERGNVAGVYKMIPLPHIGRPNWGVAGVGAGCATSWVVME